jgi:hypothetical protein
MVRFILKYALLLLPSFFVLDFLAQENLQVQALLTQKSIKMGEQVQLILRARCTQHGANYSIQFPILSDSLAPHVEMVSTTNIDTFFPEKNNPNLIGRQQAVTITSFDSGFHVIPPFRFYLNNDTSKVYETEALLLEVKSLKVDTSAASIKDIKLPFEEKYDWREDIPLYAGIIGIVALLIVVIFIVRRFLKKKPEAPAKPKITEPIHIYVLRILNDAKQNKLYAQNDTKAYYSIISEALRFYIEERSHVPALESTTEETIAALKDTDLLPAHIAQLKQLLVTSDFVKFAKMEPSAEEHDPFVNQAILFVQQTFVERPIVTEAAVNKASESNTQV